MLRFTVISLAIGCCVFYALCKAQLDSIVFIQNNPVVAEKDTIRIKLADFLILMQMDGTLCIDVRANEYYKYGHIPKAMESTYVAPANGQSIRAADRIVLYGNSSSQRDIKRLVHELGKHTDKDIVVYAGGWDEWKSCGLPVEDRP